MDAKKNEKTVIGIGYYRRKDWEQFLASADDRENLEDTYDEWLAIFHRSVRDMRAMGIEPRKVSFRLDELLEYCKKKGLKNNAETRANFFSELTRQGRTEKIQRDMTTNEFWDNLEEKLVEEMKKTTPFSEAQIRTELAQSKQTACLGYALKYGRQKRRISVEKMAQYLKTDETVIKELESGETRKFPLSLITAYLNTLNCVLTFKIEEQPRK